MKPHPPVTTTVASTILCALDIGMPHRTRRFSPQGLRAAALGAWARVRARPLDTLAALVAVAAVGYVVGYPFIVAHYPPITDFPFHATAMSILRHYWDPSWGFQQQFTLHPLEVPYISMYVIGALFALVVPMHVAAKLAAVSMLSLLPAGLAVLFHGMRKSPLLGLLGLGAVWLHLTHWGFLNFLGAIGLFAMCVGFTLLTLDRPSRGHRVGLALSLLGVFFTHLFRFPFALLAVLGTTVLVWPATRRLRPVLLPLVPSLACYGIWHWVRPKEQFDIAAQIRWTPTRLREVESYLAGGFGGSTGLEEKLLFQQFLDAALVIALSSAIWFVWQGRIRHRSFRDWWWGVSVTLLPVILAAGFLIGFLSLPMRIGLWWYVYPREVTPALFVLLAVAPDLPKQGWYRLPLVAALAFFAGRMGFHVAKQYHAFDKATADFRAVTANIPKAPKLSYLVFAHDGSTRAVTPFIHLPAWVQAEKGGALSFQFIGWNYSPIRYRQSSDTVPPPVPEHWEWQPNWFDVRRHGAWFDWFLVRRYSNPSAIYAADPSIELVANEGSWWLFKRSSQR